MVNLPFGFPFTSQIMSGQNVPVQTNQNAFQPFLPPQMATQQMQTNAAVPPYPANLQDSFKQPFYQLHQADLFTMNPSYNPSTIPLRNPHSPGFFQPSVNIPVSLQTQPNIGQLPPSVLDQIRNCASNAAPIFILPGGCHQSPNQQQSNPTNQGGVIQPTGFNSPQSIYCPPSFYPFPIPMPVFDPFATQSRGKDHFGNCVCCQKRQNDFDRKNYSVSCCCNVNEPEEHRCTATNDDTICSKRNCPAAVSLQALASQLLSLSGIIPCAATRLILRKIPGSNINSTMEDTMEKAQNCINSLTKEQLLVESRNAQQVNALINVHMISNPPANIIPLLTLLQIKVNLLKAQVESLINKKVMECQGYGYEVDSSDPIDPTVLAMKTNAELRQLLTALRERECDERVNVNFSPYHSQRVIAEARLNNVQAKIRQVEIEFDRRRCISVPSPSLTSRVVQQFSEARCLFGFAHANLFEPYVQGNAVDSPDPFAQSIRNPKRLYLKPRDIKQEPWPMKSQDRGVGTSEDCACGSKDAGTGKDCVNDSKEKSVDSRSSFGNCSCQDTSSDDSFDEDKKKLRLKIDTGGTVRVSTVGGLKDVSLFKISPNVVTQVSGICEKVKKKKPTIGKVDEEIVVERKLTKTKIEDENEENEAKEKVLNIWKVKYVDSDELVKSEVKEPSDELEEDDKNEDEDEDTKDKRSHTSLVNGKKQFDSQEHVMEVEIKKEPESPIKDKAFESKEVPIKKPEVDRRNDKKRFHDQTFKSVLVEDQVVEDLILVTKETVTIDITKEENSETEKNQGQTDKIPDNTETDMDESRRSTSSDLHEESTVIHLVPATKQKVNKQQENRKQPDSNEDQKGNELQENKKTNVQLISMMTRVKYRNPFINLSNDNVKDMKKNNELLSMEKYSSTVSIEEQCEKSISNKIFPKSDNTKGMKNENGIRCFPPLKNSYGKAKEVPDVLGTSGKTFPRRGIESQSSEMIRNISDKSGEKSGSNILSSVFKIIEHKLISASSFLADIPNLCSGIEKFRFNKFLQINKDDKPSKQTFKLFNNKRPMNLKKDWVFLPFDAEMHTDDNKRDSVDQRSVSLTKMTSLRKIKHSIIEDKDRKRYLLIRGSSSMQLRKLLKRGFKRPDRICRSLVIRSRLKDPKEDRLNSFTIVRYCKNNDGLFISQTRKQSDILKSEKTIPFIPENSEIDVDEFKTTINSNQTKDINLKNFAKVSEGTISIQNKQKTGIIDNSEISMDLNRKRTDKKNT